jgi:hypothetical protein
MSRTDKKPPYDIIPMPDFKTTHVTTRVLEQDREMTTRRREGEKIMGRHPVNPRSRTSSNHKSGGVR